ncbi:MAG: APC family permease [Chloroflexi bacterium]|nr:APC family permease [Chloroflexota bacterium]
MRQIWEPKPGDKIFRPQRLKPHRLRRVLGVTGLYAAGYGDVGSSIYYALGLVATVALGATPVVLGIAGIIFVFNSLTYAEGTAMLPEAGGSASFARHGFNDLVGFIAGWSLIFSYIITIAISAYTIPSYLSYFWAPFKDSFAIGTLAAMAIIVFLMSINIVGVKESSLVNWILVITDLCTQLLLIVLGFLLLFDKDLYFQRVTSNWPSTSNLIFGVAIAAIAFTGVESVSQMAEEAKKPEKRVPLALVSMMITVIVIFACISTIAFSVMTPQELATEWATDPIAGIANGLYQYLSERHPFVIVSTQVSPLDLLQSLIIEGVRYLLRPLVAILAATILLVATNAGLLGISRVTFHLGSHRLLPPFFSRVHSRFKTPFVAIMLFSVVAIFVQGQGFFGGGALSSLGGLYAFGSLLTFALAHASILMLRFKRPEVPRPFTFGPQIKIAGTSFPITAVLGIIGTSFVWLVLLWGQPYARVGGFMWMAIGILIYYLYRKSAGLTLTHGRSQLKPPRKHPPG